MSDSQGALHHGSHRDLLWSSRKHQPLAGNRVNAIIVPTTRDPSHLLNAARLASVLNCVLVTLHSKGRTSAAEAEQLLPTDIDLLAIDIEDSAGSLLPSWKTSALLNNTPFKRQTDLSLKRNIGIMLSWIAGWSCVLFLDDDIVFPVLSEEIVIPEESGSSQQPPATEPDEEMRQRRAAEAAAANVRKAVDLLETHNAVALQVGGFPDHSVVCHAYLDSGGDQEEFVGGGAMVFAVGRTESFFPDIYNDDWFFLLDGDNCLQPVAKVCPADPKSGVVSQLPFDPFRTPDRARSEELGEVLAEGIYWLLDQGCSLRDADVRHWRTFLRRRRQFIRRVRRMIGQTRVIDQQPVSRRERRRRKAALRGSLRQLRKIKPSFCQRYLDAWAQDRVHWQRHLDALPVRAALAELPDLLIQQGEAPQLNWRLRMRQGASAA